MRFRARPCCFCQPVLLRFSAYQDSPEKITKYVVQQFAKVGLVDAGLGFCVFFLSLTVSVKLTSSCFTVCSVSRKAPRSLIQFVSVWLGGVLKCSILRIVSLCFPCTQGVSSSDWQREYEEKIKQARTTAAVGGVHFSCPSDAGCFSSPFPALFLLHSRNGRRRCPLLARR